MSDLIDRQAAIDALCNDYCGGHQDCKYYPNCENLRSVQKLPSAQPEIVRCKDCKHWIPYDWMFSEVWRSKNMADYPEDDIGCDCSDMAMKANDFCSRGEKREVTT